MDGPWTEIVRIQVVSLNGKLNELLGKTCMEGRMKLDQDSLCTKTCFHTNFQIPPEPLQNVIWLILALSKCLYQTKRMDFVMY
jgi:hypothetical protein